MEENQPKISIAELILLLLAAIIFDFITWIPFLGTAVNLFATGLFWLIFWLKGIRLATVKALAPGIIELIPLLNLIPFWTTMVIVAYILEEVEARLAIAQKISQAAEKVGGTFAKKFAGIK